MDIKRIKTREILDDFSLRFSDRRDISSLYVSIKNSGLIAPPCAALKKEGFQLISGFSRFEASKKAGLDPIPVRIKPEDISLSQVFYNEVEVHSVNRKFTLTEKARILKIVTELDVTEHDIAAFCRLIDLPEERGVIEKTVEILNFTDDVQNYIGMYDLSLRQTAMFKGLSELEQTLFTDLAKRLHIRGVELGKIIELVQDISGRTGEQAERILKRAEKNKPEFYENRNQALAHLKEELQSMRFPKMIQINNDLTKRRKMIKGAGGIKFEWDRTLENPGILISAKIKSSKDTDRILSVISDESNRKVLNRMLEIIVP